VRAARLVAAVVVVLAVAGSAAAGPPGQWTKLPGTVINFAEPVPTAQTITVQCALCPPGVSDPTRGCP